VTDRAALSPQQAEVLRLLSAGLSIPAIAATMFISQSTAKTYVARLYEKLGVANRAQALMAAMQLGLIRYELSVRADRARPTDGELRSVSPVAAPA
jgi:DNA-binding NarL/FixJ family response regulator